MSDPAAPTVPPHPRESDPTATLPAAPPARRAATAEPGAPTAPTTEPTTAPVTIAPTPADSPPPAGPEPVSFLAGPFARRTWREFGYLNLALLLAPFGFTYVIFTVAFTAGIAVTVVGLFLSGWLVLGGRAWGGLYRSMARGMLAVDVPAPEPFRGSRGFWRSLRSTLLDGAGWRALAFLLPAFPLAIIGFVLSWTFLGVALGGMTHWYWSRWLPAVEAPDGTMHRGAQLGNGWFVDTTPRQIALVGLGVLFAYLWARITLGTAHVMRLLTANLLGPTAASQRVRDLEQARGVAVQDSDTRLRRIERDLHDGTQARLVAVAMQLGEAREQLAATPPGGDAREALDLVDSAHASTKEALAELREIARGIHPPALDNGLAVALETLAARTPLPVTVDVDQRVAPAPAVETIAYFCVAELVTNVVKHAGASGVYVLVEQSGDQLRLRIRDDGHGGAEVCTPGADGHRSGLAGLAERVRAVDGTLDVVSPPGGPTVVTVLLPMRVS
ncbi:MAG TPA: sensor histidine kinase [Cellulomonas sp.]